ARTVSPGVLKIYLEKEVLKLSFHCQLNPSKTIRRRKYMAEQNQTGGAIQRGVFLPTAPRAARRNTLPATPHQDCLRETPYFRRRTKKTSGRTYLEGRNRDPKDLGRHNSSPPVGWKAAHFRRS